MGLGGQQTGDAVGNFSSLAPVGKQRVALHCEELSGVREVHLLRLDRFGNDPTTFDAAVCLGWLLFLPGKKRIPEVVVGLWPEAWAGSP